MAQSIQAPHRGVSAARIGLVCDNVLSLSDWADRSTVPMCARLAIVTTSAWLRVFGGTGVGSEPSAACLPTFSSGCEILRSCGESRRRCGRTSPRRWRHQRRRRLAVGWGQGADVAGSLVVGSRRVVGGAELFAALLGGLCAVMTGWSLAADWATELFDCLSARASAVAPAAESARSADPIVLGPGSAFVHARAGPMVIWVEAGGAAVHVSQRFLGSPCAHKAGPHSLHRLFRFPCTQI